jgi:hypothetical protein
MATPYAERVAKAAEQERLDAIVLQENIQYNGIIFDAIRDRTKKGNYEQITFIISLTDVGYEGKLCYTTLVIDENTPNKLQGQIGFQQLVKTFTAFGIPFANEENLVMGLFNMKDKPVYLTVKKTPDKKDPSKVYTNYDFKPTPAAFQTAPVAATLPVAPVAPAPVATTEPTTFVTTPLITPQG